MTDREAELDAALIDRSSFIFQLGNNQYSDEELAGVLLRNTDRSLKYLRIELQGAGDGPWESLLEAVQTHPVITTVFLWAVVQTGGGERTSAAGVNRFLLAIRQNQRVKCVHIHHAHLTGEIISTFLDNATFLRNLLLSSMHWEEPEQDVPQLNSALQRNSNIMSLDLGEMRGQELNQILNGLACNDHLQKLELSSCDLTGTAFTGLKNLLVSSVSILTQIKFTGNWSDASLTSLLCAVEKSDLKSLELGHIRTLDQARLLLQSIPKMTKLRELRVEFLEPGFFRYEDEAEIRVFGPTRTEIIEAVKQNGSLTKVRAKLNLRPMFSDDQMRVLDYCCARNRGMDAWVDSPTRIHQGAWPNAFCKGWETGPDKVYQALVAASPAIQPKGRKGKRKRADFDSP